ncbi:MAG TPA: hypothetical protein VLB87_09815 [Pyrinomonadaceae bacterium]|nr:hypothetical protein [Pyrinomonadaceae bacterium]
MKITVSSPAEVLVRIESVSPGREWSFLNAYAGVLGLGERIEQFRAYAPGGADAGAQKIATGEFRSNVPATSIEYVVRLPPPNAADVAHVSWITGESGLLMLGDLLPQWLPGVEVEFSLPAGWSAQSICETDANGKHKVVRPEHTVFLIGRGLRRQSKRIDRGVFDLVVDSSWPFKDAVVLEAARKVLEKYRALTGMPLPAKPVVIVAPLPVATGSVKWRAETRGSTVVLLLDPQANIENWAGQLGIIFTHELLHLWVPNSLLLQGDYDWFFEGFTLYTALVTALELKFIDRNEYVATLERVYDAYLSRPDELSLIDASERRWTTGNPVVYDKGMLVAFLYDRAIRKDSRGKMSLASVYRKLFARPAGLPENGNDVIIKLLSSTPAGADLARSYIEGQREIDLKPLFADQKQLLKSLYYR